MRKDNYAGTEVTARHNEFHGWIASLSLHTAFVLLVLVLTRHATIQRLDSGRLIPVDVVQLAEQTSSPVAQHRVAVSEQRASVSRPWHPRAVGHARSDRPLATSDAIEARIRGLSRLREQDMPLPALDNSGIASADIGGQTGDAAATYNIRDYIRNQIERRWNINLARLGRRRMVVELHVLLKPSGVVSRAEIVDKERFATDAAWRDVALSARNAVLLSSPITFPGGPRVGAIDVILRLDPRDMLR